jgi:PKD repeat protein
VTVKDRNNETATAKCPAITVTIPQDTLKISCNASPTLGNIPLDVNFTASVSGGSQSYVSYYWDFDDSISATTIDGKTSHKYYSQGQYYSKVTVTDSEGKTASANCPTITATIPKLNVESIECFPRVIEGYNQSCQIHVTADGIISGGVDVDVYFFDEEGAAPGPLFGSCTTDSLSGGCTVYKTMPLIGNYTVFAMASKAYHVNDSNTYPRYSFQVWKKSYDIINLDTYNDSLFKNPDKVFYRGEPLYIKFQVYDPIEHTFVTDDIVTTASLVSEPGGKADMSRLYYNDDWYYYQLEEIPLTHDFLGSSNVFAFAFNFSDNTGAEAQTDIIILNNKPFVDDLPEFDMVVGETQNINLNNYGFDLEDDHNLKWEIILLNMQPAQSVYDARIGYVMGQPILYVTGLASGAEQLKLRAYDLDNEYDEESTIVRVHPLIKNITVSCTANPLAGEAPLNVTFTAIPSGGSGEYRIYSWNFDDGESYEGSSPNAGHTYNAMGDYDAAVTVTDSNGNTGKGYCPSISVAEEYHEPLYATCSAYPQSGYIPLSVSFDVVASGGTGQYIYKWVFDDGSTKMTSIDNIVHEYTLQGDYSPEVIITDSDGRVYVASCPAINALEEEEHDLIISEISCFPTIVAGSNQSCSVHVTSDGKIVGGADIDIIFIGGSVAGYDGKNFGSCKTDELSGGCTVYRQIDDAGRFTVYAVASKEGYNSDNDTWPRSSFDVLTRRYDIIGLKVYNDSMFSNEDYEFYRGEPLYVKFRVYDLLENRYVNDDIVTTASLVSSPGGVADLTRINFVSDSYYYTLDQIPLTHDFLGSSNVFAFAFNFSDQSGGQAQVELTILNNKPLIAPLPFIQVYVGELVSLDLCQYGFDLEDNNNLRWTAYENSAIVDASMSGCVLTLYGISEGDAIVNIRVYDLDNDYAEGIIGVSVVQRIHPISASCTASPTLGSAPLSVDFGVIVQGGNGVYDYLWSFGNSVVVSGNENFDTIHYTYNAPGIFQPTVVVSDSDGRSTIAYCPLITVSIPQADIVADAGGPYTGYVNVPLMFDASSSRGSITMYKWDFGDGTVINSTLPQANHTYINKIGLFNVKLTVYDTYGRSDSDTTTVRLLDKVIPKPEPVREDKGLFVERIIIYGTNGEIIKQDDDVIVSVDVSNDHDFDIKNARMSAEITELGLKSTSKSFNLKSGQDKTVSVMLPVYDLPQGYYYVKIMVGNDDIRRIKYREIIVK